MSSEWNRFPIVSLDEAAQARRDAQELHETVLCTAQHYRVARDRMARALAVLAQSWPRQAPRDEA